LALEQEAENVAWHCVRRDRCQKKSITVEEKPFILEEEKGPQTKKNESKKGRKKLPILKKTAWNFSWNSTHGNSS